MEKLDPSYIAGGIVKWYSHFKEQSSWWNNYLWYNHFTLGMYSKERKAYTKNFVTLSIPTRGDKKMRVSVQFNINEVLTHTKNIIKKPLRKHMNPFIRNVSSR